MIEPESSSQDTQRRWREIAAQLGLDADPAPEPPPARPRKEEAPAIRQEPTPPAKPALEPPSPRIAEPILISHRQEPAADETPSFGEGIVVSQEAPGDDAGNEPEDAPRSGRRRRRRGRRSSREKAEATPPDVEAVREEPAAIEESVVEPLEPVESEALAEEPTPERSRRRGRGRSRRGKEERQPSPARAAPVEAELEEEPEELVRRTGDEEEDEGEDMSSLNVPSWQELIASLYRPDRDRDR